MPITLLEINDIESRLWQSDSTVVSEPGWALLTDPPVVGQTALDQARLQPRLTNCRFWQALNTDPMPGAIQAARHHADLAYLQLTAFKALAPKTEFAVCVPGHYDRTDLSLLLGLMAAADLPVKALIDPGVLLARSAGTTMSDVLYLDVGLHAVTLTVIQQGAQLHRRSCNIAHSAGYLSLIDRLANDCASALVRKSRFDPLQQASTEQQLFKQLLQDDQTHYPLGHHLISLDHDGVQYDVQLTETELRAAAADLVPDVVKAVRAASNGAAQVLISHRANRLPGLIDSLSLVPGLVTQILTSTSLLEAFTAFAPELVESPAHNQLIYSLANPNHDTQARNEATPSDLSVSHVVQQGVAIGLAAFSETVPQDFGLALDPISARWQLIPGAASIAINQQTLTEPCWIKPGDVVLTGDQSFQFIQVL